MQSDETGEHDNQTGDAQEPHRLSDKERFDWLRLIRSESIGPATFHDLVRCFGNAGKALEQAPDLARRGGARRPIRIAAASDIEQEWQQVHQSGARFVALGEPDYPRALAHIHAPPPILTLAGKAELAQKTVLSIVGSRNCSAIGIKLARMLAYDLGAEGITIASGLARGVDTAAHQGSLSTGTIAVVAGGLNRIFPKENLDLAHDIARQGLLVSEMPWNWQGRSQDFPRRNRIISGVAAGTLVIEAAKRSGTLITARYALEQGREVFAIPGSPLDPRAEGTNNLIKQGASLVCNAEDILASLTQQLPYSRPLAGSIKESDISNSADRLEEDPGGAVRDAFVRILSPTPITMDELVRQSDLSPGDVQMLLLELDLAGKLERHGNQSVSLIP
ncbi:DNA processing protein [Cohaesibacter sp. ES.047]|uniref:DNA-processing protein DprA n=1 Tax=Cohaesibacter sp. ES.047 TaxID=1798205 RepID=UPI000BB6FBBE|nr:DNA-processing protein DprA [Cohaesibacter sp. ES.047]SNY93905.1 DNA processing protein [Cohaesibacter sp. ES.047]